MLINYIEYVALPVYILPNLVQPKNIQKPGRVIYDFSVGARDGNTDLTQTPKLSWGRRFDSRTKHFWKPKNFGEKIRMSLWVAEW